MKKRMILLLLVLLTSPIFAKVKVRTNMLGLVGGIYNAGVEYELMDRLSIDANFWYQKGLELSFTEPEKTAKDYLKWGTLIRYYFIPDSLYVGVGYAKVIESVLFHKYIGFEKVGVFTKDIEFDMIDFKFGQDFSLMKDYRLKFGYSIGYTHPLTDEEKYKNVTVKSSGYPNIGSSISYEF